MSTVSVLDLAALHAEARPDVERLVDALDAVAALPVRRRWSWLAIALDRSTDADPRVRTAAIHVLAGATGLPALERLTAALDDGEASVRHAAADALVGSSRRDPAVLAPALYHAREDVQSRAVDGALALGRRTPWHLLAPLVAAPAPLGGRVYDALCVADLDDLALHRLVSLAESGLLPVDLVADRILAATLWDAPSQLAAMGMRRRGVLMPRSQPFDQNVGRLLHAVMTDEHGVREPDRLIPIVRRVWRLIDEGRLASWAANHVSNSIMATGVAAPESDAIRTYVSIASLSSLPALRGRRALDAVEHLRCGGVSSAPILARLVSSALCAGSSGELNLHRAAHLLSRATPSAITEDVVRAVEGHAGFEAACAANPRMLGAWTVYVSRHVVDATASRLTVIAAQKPMQVGTVIAGAMVRIATRAPHISVALIGAGGYPALGDILVALAREWDAAPATHLAHGFVPRRPRCREAIEHVFAWLSGELPDLASRNVAAAVRTLVDTDGDGPTAGLGVVLAQVALHGHADICAAVDAVLDELGDDTRVYVDALARRASADPAVRARHPMQAPESKRPRIGHRVANAARRIGDALRARPSHARTPIQREAARRRLVVRGALERLDHPSGPVAEDAARTLLAVAPARVDAIADRILAPHPLRSAVHLVATLPDWPTGSPARTRVVEALADGALGPGMRFRLATVLAVNGHPGYADLAVALAGVPWTDRRATRDDADALQATLGAETAKPILADSPHAMFRLRAWSEVASVASPAGSALAATLLRRDAADRAIGPMLPTALADVDHPDAWRVLEPREAHGDRGSVDAMIDRALEVTRCRMIAGDGILAGASPAAEAHTVTACTKLPVDIRAEALLMAAEMGRYPTSQARAMAAARSWLYRSRTERAARLATLFAWGEAQSLRLLGRRLKIELIAGSALGYTRLEGDTIHINPLPLLRNERHGEDIARGLIVHELGHHVYNGDTVGRDCWSKAVRRGLGSLMNLVCDEHLERNLRATDARYGDHFKRLGAWAFQRASRQMTVPALFDAVGRHAAIALPGSSLAPGREVGTVRIEVGRLIDALARSGSKLSLFLRALRLGLGDRFDDETIREALSLFGRDFRRLDNPGLLAVTELLADHFRDELPLMDVFDLHGIADGDAGDRIVAGRGVTDDDVREVQNSQRSASDDKATGSATFNRGAKATFDTIETVERLPFEPEAWLSLRDDVAPAARRLQKVFARLGETVVRVRRRPAGHRIDRAGAPGQLVRRDPRLLQRRVVRRDADLFVSVVVDCSGSMNGDRMVRARRFAALVASAARSVEGVDLRVFGFTDRVIYDAGDHRRPAIAGLKAGGGNNDAAGLAHAAWIARRSPRPHRLLIMISDGLPTECTTTALRELVQRLTRQGMLCAQVAVAPLREQCFEHYIEVLDADLDASTRAFGQIVERLAATAIRGR